MKKRNNFVRFLSYVRPYWTFILIGAVGGVIKFTIPLLVPQVTRYLLDHVYMNDTLTTRDKLQELFLYVGGMLGIFVVVWGPGTFVRHYFTAKAGQRSIFDLRRDLYNHIIRMSAAFFEDNQSGSIVSRIMGDVELAKNLVGRALTNVWMDAASVIVVLTFMIQINVPVTLVALSTMPIYVYVFKRLRKEIRASTRQVRKEIADMSGNVQEKISGSSVIHAFTQERNEGKRFLGDAKRLLSATMQRAFHQSLNMTLTGGLTQLSPLIVTLFAGYQVIQGNMSVGDWVAVSLYLKPLYTPLRRFSDLNVVFANSMAAVDRIFEILDRAPRVRDREDAIRLEAVEGEVAFEQARFSYPNVLGSKKRPVLQNISFVAEPGERFALVGPSGAGKSTLVSLIPRFYDIRSGKVKVDGHDVRDIKVRSLRQHIGVVFQDSILFSGTVIENLLFGNPEATEEQVVDACRAANAYDFIQALPNGFDTDVGERGTFLSGGQKQRLTIARAFLKDPKILILDEPTASLDAESEQLIQEALEHLMEGRTTFIIAHRLATIVSADQILVLEEGAIVEKGTHKELLTKGGLYSELYQQQFESASSSLKLLKAS